jgi:hypothetical protein
LPGVELIALSEHVDHWNRLGWKDPFSSALYSARQGEYANRFHLETVFTPQLVIDGKTQVVGNDRREVFSAIGRSMHDPKLPITISEAVRAGTDVTAAFAVPGTERSNGTALMYTRLLQHPIRLDNAAAGINGRRLSLQCRGGGACRKHGDFRYQVCPGLLDDLMARI